MSDWLLVPWGKGLILKGDTQSIKEELKECGGKWNGVLRGWIFSAKRKMDVLGIDDSIKFVDVTESVEEKGENECEESLVLCPYKSALILRGDTKTLRDDLKKCGGKWNKVLKGWIFSSRRKDEVMSVDNRILYKNDPPVINEKSKGCVEEAETQTVESGKAVLRPYKRGLLLTGGTKPCRIELKKCGGKWNKKLNGWIFSVDKKNIVLEISPTFKYEK